MILMPMTCMYTNYNVRSSCLWHVYILTNHVMSMILMMTPKPLNRSYCLFYNFVWLIFRPVEFNICLPVSAHGLWYWFMLLTLFTGLTNVSVLYWTVRFYCYGFLVNEGTDLILVIQTFHLSAVIFAGISMPWIVMQFHGVQLRHFAGLLPSHYK